MVAQNIVHVKNAGYRPLVDGLLAELEPHMDLNSLKDIDGFVDGHTVLGQFAFSDCHFGDEEDCCEDKQCVCGHKIKNLFWIAAPQIPHSVLVGMCCVKRFGDGNPALVHDAKVVMDRRKALQRMVAEPEVRCVCCGKKRVPVGSIAHKACRQEIIPLLLEKSKPTKFITKLRDSNHLTNGQVSALTSTRFWNNAQRVELYKAYHIPRPIVCSSFSNSSLRCLRL